MSSRKSYVDKDKSHTITFKIRNYVMQQILLTLRTKPSNKVHAQLIAEGVYGAFRLKLYVLLIFKSAIYICFFITFTDCLYTYTYVIVGFIAYSISVYHK
jgi:hypothetical protein